MILNPAYTVNMTEHQRAWFYAEYQQASKDEVVGVLFALFLGNFGIHKFYLGETGWGVAYLLFFWTGIPAILGFVECFLMPGRIRAYNAARAQDIAARILASPIPTEAYLPVPPASLAAESVPAPQFCAGCGGAVDAGAAFCPHCGAAVARAS